MRLTLKRNKTDPDMIELLAHPEYRRSGELWAVLHQDVFYGGKEDIGSILAALKDSDSVEIELKLVED